MVIVEIPSWYKTKAEPNSGSFFFEQAKALANQNNKVILVDVTLRGKRTIFCKDNFRLVRYSDQDIEIFQYVSPALGIPRISARLPIYVTYRRLSRILKLIAREYGPIDVLHAHSIFPAGAAAVMIGRKLGIPVCVSEHSSDIQNKQVTRIEKRIITKTLKAVSVFITVGNALKQSVLDIIETRKEIVVIPNLVNSSFFELPLSKKKQNSFIFLCVGNCLPSKRWDLTIKSFARTFSTNPQVQLHFCGDGPLMDEMKALVSKLGMVERIHFLGRVSREKMPLMMSSSNVFVLPSDYETFGVVYIEALACGVPVIGTRNGGAESIINEKVGLLIPANDEDSLCKAMETMYTKFHDYDSQMIREECYRLYSEEAVGKQIMKEFLRISEEGKTNHE